MTPSKGTLTSGTTPYIHMCAFRPLEMPKGTMYGATNPGGTTYNIMYHLHM